MEIGSEFWKRRSYPEDNYVQYFLSGRTALDVIIKDAVKNYGIESVLLPSYCCHTMIEPFLNNAVRVRFYDIYYETKNSLTAEIPLPEKNEMLYLMRYFGDTDILFKGEGKELKGWTATIEDMTHSCFSKQYNTTADYWFSSYRKWFAVEGIAAARKKEGILPDYSEKICEEYLKLRKSAFALKQDFIDGKDVTKEDFLSVFRKAEKVLEEKYEGYGADFISIVEFYCFFDRINQVRQVRRRNVQILQEGLSSCRGVSFITDFTEKNKCPLFLPILVEESHRDKLRKILIEHQIYCPVHWPLSKSHEGISQRARRLYQQEISLVCDQRYNELDMKRIVDVINKYMT